MGAGKSIAGRKNSDCIDFYQTPKWAIDKLLEREKFDGVIAEPCCGNGAISRVLEAHGYSVLSSDIRTDQAVYGDKGIDFFSSGSLADHIVTNPPYFCAQEFIEHALLLATGKVAMLLKLTFLESAKRHRFFQTAPLRTVYVFCNRVTMYPDNQPAPTNGGTIAYAWFIWEKGHVGAPEIAWLI